MAHNEFSMNLLYIVPINFIAKSYYDDNVIVVQRAIIFHYREVYSW